MKCSEHQLETKKVLISIYEHEATGWFVAKSDDVPNFYAHGESVGAIRRKVPGLLRAFFEATGYCVDRVNTEIDKTVPEGFFPVKLYAKARIEASVSA